MEELVVGLHKWRKLVRKKILAKDPDHSCAACTDIDKYNGYTKNLSAFSTHLCPCQRGDDGLRKLECAQGRCAHCGNVLENLVVCAGEADFAATTVVKYKWLRAIQIGTRHDTEWAYFEKSYADFQSLLVQYFVETYRLHNWVYKRQVTYDYFLYLLFFLHALFVYVILHFFITGFSEARVSSAIAKRSNNTRA